MIPQYFEDNPKKPVHVKNLRSVEYIFSHDPEPGINPHLRRPSKSQIFLLTDMPHSGIIHATIGNQGVRCF